MTRIPLVNLAGPAPYRPTYRPFTPPVSSRFRQPMLSSKQTVRPSLGAYSQERLGTSIVLGTAGALAFFAGGVLPTPWDMLVKAAGIAAVGYGAYHLFVGPGTSESRLPSAQAFDKIYAEWVTPKQNQTVNGDFWGNTHPQLKITNGSSEPVDFTLSVTQKEVCSTLTGDSVNEKDLEPRTISLAPGGQKIETFDVGTLCSAFRGRLYINETLVAKKFRYGPTSGGSDLDTISYKVEL